MQLKILPKEEPKNVSSFPTQRFSWKSGILLSIGSIVLTFALLEIPIRMYWDKLNSPPNWSDRPSFYYVPEHSRGVSDYEYRVPKPSGVFRIAAVGDSFTFTPYMQFDDAFPKRLERMINMNESSKPNPAEVINYGKWGASTKSEVSAVSKALHEGADLVVLEITLNDAQFSRYEASNKALQKDYTLGKLEISPEHNWLYYYWRGLGLLATRYHNYLTVDSTIRYHRELFERSANWDSFTSSLLEMKRLCDSKGVKFVAFVFPFIHYPFGDSYPFKNTHLKINRFLTDQGIENFDVLPAFNNIPSERLIVAPGIDNHPNEIAHRIVAEQLYDFLESNKLIPEAFIIKEEFTKRGHAARLRGQRNQRGSELPNPENTSVAVFD